MCFVRHATGTIRRNLDWSFGQTFSEEEIMPVILLWAIPSVLVIGGGGYWLMHLHH